MKRIAILLLGVGLLPGLAGSTAAEDAKTGGSETLAIDVRVDGLSCPFCAYSLEKQLDDLAGVEVREIRIRDGVVALVAPSGEPVDYAAIPEAVRNAGFTPRDIRVSGTALARRVGDGPALVTPEGEVLIRLGGESPEGGWPETGSLRVRFAGVIREAETKSDAGPRLELSEVAIAGAEARSHGES